MNIHDEFDTFLSNRKLTLSNRQRTVAALFLNANSQDQTWLRARQSGVTTLFNALEDFYKYHQLGTSRLEDWFWYNAKCQTCGTINDKALDSFAGWRFYHPLTGTALTYTCPKCPELPGAKIGYER